MISHESREAWRTPALHLIDDRVASGHAENICQLHKCLNQDTDGGNVPVCQRRETRYFFKKNGYKSELFGMERD